MAKDQYAQIAYLRVTESAINTLTFAGLSVFSNVLSQMAMLIHRVEYKPTNTTWNLLDASGDELTMGICGDDGLADVSLEDAEVYDMHSVRVKEYGAPANSVVQNEILLTDFSSLPGGGKLVPADRVFSFVQGGLLAAVGTVAVRVYFTLLDMSAADYLELAQSMRVLR